MKAKQLIEALTPILMGVVLFYFINSILLKGYNYFAGKGQMPVYEQSLPTLYQPSLSAQKSKLIFVKTDTMDVVVDKEGGNVIGVRLRDYKGGGEDYQTLPMNSDAALNASAGLAQNPITYQSAASQYDMAEADKLLVRLHYQKDGVKYYKNLTFTKGAYDIKVESSVYNGSSSAVSVRPSVDLAGVQRVEAGSSKPSNISIQSGDKAGYLNRMYEGFSQAGRKKSYQRVPFDKLDSNKGQTVRGGWIAYQDGHFVTAWVLPKDMPAKTGTAFAQIELENQTDQKFASTAHGNAIQVDPGQTQSFVATLYSGPAIAENLDTLAPGLKLTVDYGFFWMIASLLNKTMSLFHNLGFSWAISMLLMLVVTRFPILMQVKSTAKLKKLKPELDAIERKYEGRSKFDPKRSEETMALYRKHKVNPASSLVGLLLSIPMYIATYSMLVASVALRGQSFLWVPDLTQPDPYFIVPFLAGIGLYLSQKDTPISDPTIKMMIKLMPLVFVATTFSAPSCIPIYIFVQLSIQSMASVVYNK